MRAAVHPVRVQRAFRVGNLVIPQIGVTFRSPTGETGLTPTIEIPILITSVIQPGEDPGEIRPLKPQLRLPGAAPQLPAIAVQAALALVVLVMLALITVAGLGLVWSLMARAGFRPAAMTGAIQVSAGGSPRRAKKMLSDAS